jgi:hypothetical protein
MVVKCHKSKVSQKENFQGKAFENAKFANIYASIAVQRLVEKECPLVEAQDRHDPKD